MDGKRNGFMRTYNQNGSVSMQGLYKIGVKDSIWNYYDDSGKLEIKVLYKKGVVQNQDELEKYLIETDKVMYYHDKD